MKVIYTPGLTLSSPIGLRNDPHTATILHMGSAQRDTFEGAMTQMTPFERRDFEQWRDSESGEAFSKWGERAFAMAAAFQLVEEAFGQEGEEAEVDPGLQRLADLNWSVQAHSHWLLIIAFVIAFIVFFFTGGMSGSVVSWIRLIATIVVAALVIVWIGTKLLPSVIGVRARRLGQAVPQREAQPVEDLPIWAEESAISSAKILNHANWVMLAQPGAGALIDLRPPDPVEPTDAYSERQVKILEAARRWRDDSPLRPKQRD